MVLHRPRLVLVLLLILGIAALWSAAAVAGPETDTVRQYSAVEVSHEDDDLVLTDVATGEERRPSSVNVDDNVVCLPGASRDCSLAIQEYEGEINSSGAESAFSHAYIDGEFYRLEYNWSADLEFEFEPTTAERAFDRLAVDSDQLSSAERDAIEDGRTVTTEPLTNANRLVEYGGQYYTLQQTGSKTYGDTVTFCGSSGDDFCDRADRVRWTALLTQYALGGLGALGAAVGGLGLFRELRPPESDT